MPTPAITNGEEQFFVTTYEGTGTGQKVGKFVPFTNSGTIDNSCIFNSADNANLSRTPSGAGNRKTFTISFWIKRAKLNTTNGQQILTSHTDTNNRFQMFFDSSVGGGAVGNKLTCFNTDSGTNINLFETNRTFEDTSKFYHILLAFDTTQSTASDRMKLYIDGDQITSFNVVNYPAQDYQLRWNINATHLIGKYGASTAYPLDAYLAEFNNVDGTALTPSTFGVTDTSTGRWIPKTLSGITYGTNGFRLKFQDSSSLGSDTSGNVNHFTANNLASTDQTTDSPTQNFPTFSMAGPYIGNLQSAQEGNLKIVMTSGTGYPAVRALKEIPQSGKWYWEVKAEQVGANQSISNASYGVLDLNIIDVNGLNVSKPFTRQIGGMGLEMYSGAIFTGLLTSAGGSATDFTIGSTSMGDDDYIVFAFDMDNGKAWWGWNDSSAGSSVVWFANDGGTDGDPGAGTNPTVTFNPSSHRFVPTQGGYAPGAGYSANFIFNFGSKPFAFTAPTGFSGLSQNNFPETGKGKPDLVWIKNRDAADAHQLYDTNRGPQKDLNISTVQESTTTDGLQKFLKGGFQIEDDVSINTVGESYVSWNWVCNGGTTSTNETGSINSTTQVNSTAGFSIIQHTGNGTNGATYGHGLSQAPTFLIVKNTSTNNRDWMVWHHKLTDGSYFVDLNQAEQQIQSTSYTNSTAPSSTVITIGTSAIINGNGESYVTYAFHEVEGFSKFGSYEGNSNANGPFVYTGFKPAVILFKNIDTAGTNWTIVDNKRNPTNPAPKLLVPNGTDTEYDYTSSYPMDILSNGFKIRANTTIMNQNTIAYIAFAEHPFIGDGTSPVTAR